MNNTIEQYNKLRKKCCTTLEDIMKDIVKDTALAIDDDLCNLIKYIRSGKYSNEEIVEIIERIRRKDYIIGKKIMSSCI